MFHWLAANWGTILICVVLAAIVAGIVIKIVKDKKAGKSSCGCNCKTCGGACHACQKPCDSKR